MKLDIEKLAASELSIRISFLLNSFMMLVGEDAM